MGPKPNDKNASEKRRHGDQEEKHRGEGGVKTEADGGVMCLQAKKQQDLAAAARSYEAGMEEILAQSLPKEATLLTP